MIYKTIPIVERADGSLQIDARNINLRQGDYNFKLQYSTNKDYSEYSPIVNVQVAFRRKDGQQTGWLTLQHIRAKEYSINLKNTWFTKEAGILYMTFRVFQTSNTNVQLIINTASASLPITPIANWNPEEEDLLPSEFEVYMSQTNEKFKEVDDELSDLRNDLSLSQLGKGIFDTEQELLNTYPNGVDYPEGTWAVLLSTNTVWLYNSQTKQWYNSGKDVTEIFDLNDNVYRFAKQLYEESYNLVNPNETTKDFIDASGNLLQGHDTDKFLLVKCGAKTIYLKAQSHIGSPSSRITEYNSSGTFIKRTLINTTDIVAGTSYTPSSSASTLDIRTNDTTDSYFEDFIISYYKEALTNYQPYNPNRNITNSEAEFLKEQHEKSLNDLYIKDRSYDLSGIAININDGVVTINGTSASSYWRVIEFGKPLEIGNYSYNLFPSGTKPSNRGLELRTISGKTISLPSQESGVINITEEVNLMRIYVDNGLSFDNYVIKPIFVKDSDIIPNVFYVYNSNKHISNEQSDLLYSEFEKQKNLLNYRNVLPSTQNGMTASFDEASGAIRFRGTPTLTYARVFDNVNTFLPAGDYVFSVLQSTGVNSVLRLTFEDNTTQDYYIVPTGLERKITATKNIIKYRIFIENIVVGNEYDLMLYYQLEKGAIRTNWVKWYGEIVNKIDITPVLLWENATPNGELPSSYKALKQTIKSGDVVRITWVQNSSSNTSLPTISEFVFNGNVADGYLTFMSSVNLNKYFRCRAFTIESSGIDFKNGEGGSFDSISQNNNYCVPLKVELVNY